MVTANRTTAFTATDGTLDASQANIVFTAAVSGVASPSYVWTFSGFQTSPTNSGTNTLTVTQAQFGTSKAATITCTVNGTYVDRITIVRLEKSTAAANATVGATIGVNLSGQITPANASTFIANAAIQSAQIANLAVTNAHIVNASIDNLKIGDSAVTETKIADLSVTSAKIGHAAVDTISIAGNAVTVPVSATGTTTCTTPSTDFGGGKVQVSAFQKFDINFGAAGTGTDNVLTVTLTLKRGTTVLSSVTRQFSGASYTSGLGDIFIMYVDSPSAATSYTAVVTVSTLTSSVYGQALTLNCIGAKR
jgi:hypothetical protein